MEHFYPRLIISLYSLKIISIISQKLSIISQKTLYNLSKSSLHILSKYPLYPLSFNLSLYSHSIIQIIPTHDHLGMNFTFVLVQLVSLKICIQRKIIRNFSDILLCAIRSLWFTCLKQTSCFERWLCQIGKLCTTSLKSTTYERKLSDQK